MTCWPLQLNKTFFLWGGGGRGQSCKKNCFECARSHLCSELTKLNWIDVKREFAKSILDVLVGFFLTVSIFSPCSSNRLKVCTNSESYLDFFCFVSNFLQLVNSPESRGPAKVTHELDMNLVQSRDAQTIMKTSLQLPFFVLFCYNHSMEDACKWCAEDSEEACSSPHPNVVLW